jgi:hypothetical protein
VDFPYTRAMSTSATHVFSRFSVDPQQVDFQPVAQHMYALMLRNVESEVYRSRTPLIPWCSSPSASSPLPHVRPMHQELAKTTSSTGYATPPSPRLKSPSRPPRKAGHPCMTGEGQVLTSRERHILEGTAQDLRQRPAQTAAAHKVRWLLGGGASSQELANRFHERAHPASLRRCSADLHALSTRGGLELEGMELL